MSMMMLVAMVLLIAGVVLHATSKSGWAAVAFSVAAVILFSSAANPYDDTDPPGEKERSGLRLLTDAKTGCQYLAAGIAGGITPRIDDRGNPICVKRGEVRNAIPR